MSFHLKTNDIAIIGIFTAFLIIISQISIPPIFSPIPITIQTFGIAITGVVLGWKLGLLSVISYILLGSFGLPVFANFNGGLNYIIGMTGGYILSWPILVFACGLPIRLKNYKLKVFLTIIFSLLGLIINEIIGCFYWAALSENKNLYSIFMYSFITFIPKDIILTILAVILGSQIKIFLYKNCILNNKVP